MELKGYKGFNKDLTCRDFQYEIGKEYKYEGNIKLCSEGFHFCRKLIDIHRYYNLKDEEVRVCEIIASGNIIEGDDKCVTDTIKIIRELSKEEMEEMKNIGKENTGIREHRKLEHRKLERRKREHRKQEHRKQERRKREHRKQEHRKQERRRLEHRRWEYRLFLHSQAANEVF